MKPLFDLQEVYLKGYSQKMFPFECEYCKNIFYCIGKQIKRVLKRKLNKIRFCNNKCAGLFISQPMKSKCSNCKKEIITTLGRRSQSKHKKYFCSRTCRAIFFNRKKTYGGRRSKLEIWLEAQLKLIYGKIILFNNRKQIGFELDIYIPKIKLAFELNGPVHYKPIFGEDKFAKTLKRDADKLQFCKEKNIELIIIDVSNETQKLHKYAQKYLDLIIQIINNKIKTL